MTLDLISKEEGGIQLYSNRSVACDDFRNSGNYISLVGLIKKYRILISGFQISSDFREIGV